MMADYDLDLIDRARQLQKVINDLTGERSVAQTCLACGKPVYGPEMLHTRPKHWMEELSARGGIR